MVKLIRTYLRESADPLNKAVGLVIHFSKRQARSVGSLLHNGRILHKALE
jgi:hypothetical protein